MTRRNFSTLNHRGGCQSIRTSFPTRQQMTRTRTMTGKDCRSARSPSPAAVWIWSRPAHWLLPLAVSFVLGCPEEVAGGGSANGQPANPLVGTAATEDSADPTQGPPEGPDPIALFPQ